ncbi:CDP-glucose 4,6-dehydratase [Cupriavidus sp. USMAA2-4]|uniref:CDP-glucose 4,6-dehydratase n=1 Tax=Cupriavidus malaysiensis TaxID=367825 RepID=A0ABN4TWT4_9BURK|nr:CDP-glucose 4,6-dehydratase [Cupriavidus sp. USMAA2-4]AOZ10989.1 CDP-glucose 4,6-dehydratase [Cupriavidus malaysiensis]
MEGLAVKQFGDIFAGRRVLLTGHTGFKGSWLALWLTRLGASVTGYALAPTGERNHWRQLDLPVAHREGDLRDLAGLDAAFAASRPEIVFHLAAQPLVRQSYREPLDTWSVNLMGTANLLELCRRHPQVRAVVVVTTDKVYHNREWAWGYRESDTLGGIDPYAASKAAAELAAQSYRQAFLEARGILLATARAGNVIGGGDWSEDRLLPDLVRAQAAGQPLQVRSPRATRPWQHVLDCLSGYLLLGQRLLAGDASCARAWNFGPAADDNRSVGAVLERMRAFWPELGWVDADTAGPHEAALLGLDSAEARKLLGWAPVWRLDDALRATAQWYRQALQGGAGLTHAQLADYIDCAAGAGAVWTSA